MYIRSRLCILEVDYVYSKSTLKLTPIVELGSQADFVLLVDSQCRTLFASRVDK